MTIVDALHGFTNCIIGFIGTITDMAYFILRSKQSKLSQMRVLLAILLYIASVALIAWLRPAFMFDDAGRLKSPGLAQDGTQSILAGAIFFPVLAALIYYVLVVIEFVLKKRSTK